MTTSSAPPQAAAVGYNTLTFGTVSNFSRSNVDMGLTYQPGFQWYFDNMFGVQPSSAATTLNSDGSITVGSFGYDANAVIQTVVAVGRNWRGTAFGGGAYVEATLAFNASTVNWRLGWPSWWTMPLEHMAAAAAGNFMTASSPDQWAGQAAGYEHFVEADIMEKMDSNTYDYAGAVHDWYGHYAQSCSGAPYCGYTTPWSQAGHYPPGGNVNWNVYHRYGMLWIPATATAKGSLRYYFDGVQVGPTISWSQYTNQAPVPTSATPWTFGHLDQEHLVLILGTGPTTPMQVKQVVVWQASAAQNLRQ